MHASRTGHCHTTLSFRMLLNSMFSLIKSTPSIPPSKPRKMKGINSKVSQLWE